MTNLIIMTYYYYTAQQIIKILLYFAYIIINILNCHEFPQFIM